MPATPPERIDLDRVVVRRESVADAPAVADAIASNIHRLAPWMAWATVESADVTSQRNRIADGFADWASGAVYDYVVTTASGDAVLGKTGLRRTGADVFEIGYWLTEEAEGRGIITAACSALTEVALAVDEIARVEIRCDAANARSRAVPERMGYRLDRVQDCAVTASHQTGRELVWVYDAVV